MGSAQESAPGQERPIEKRISDFHAALIQLLVEDGEFFHGDEGDYAYSITPFDVIKEGRPSSSKASLYVASVFFECNRKHNQNSGYELPADTMVQVVFYGEPHLEVTPNRASIFDQKGQFLRKAEAGDLQYFATMAGFGDLVPSEDGSCDWDDEFPEDWEADYTDSHAFASWHREQIIGWGDGESYIIEVEGEEDEGTIKHLIEEHTGEDSALVITKVPFDGRGERFVISTNGSKYAPRHFSDEDGIGSSEPRNN